MSAQHISESRFFTEEIYNNENNLAVNEEMMKSIQSNTQLDQQHIGFVFITDLNEKAFALKNYISENIPCYTGLSVRSMPELWEISGTTCYVKMVAAEINKWNQKMWDLGYQFDCILDGWQINNS